jgi:hypothetical protein
MVVDVRFSFPAAGPLCQCRRQAVFMLRRDAQMRLSPAILVLLRSMPHPKEWTNVRDRIHKTEPL